MKYCLDDFLEGIKSIDFDNYTLLLVDNSDTDSYYNIIKEKKINVLRFNPEDKNKINRLIDSRNKIIEYAISKNCDFILMLDQDVIVPPNIINKLLSSKKDLISGVYLNYFYSSGKLKFLPVAWLDITEEEFEQIKSKQIKFPEYVKSAKDLSRHMTLEEYESNKTYKVKHPSAGCLLISKNIFEKIKYENLDLKSMGFKTEKQALDDLGFRKRANELGFDFYIDTSVKCKHLIDGKYIKDEKGNLHHPIRYNEDEKINPQ